MARVVFDGVKAGSVAWLDGNTNIVEAITTLNAPPITRPPERDPEPVDDAPAIPFEPGMPKALREHVEAWNADVHNTAVQRAAVPPEVIPHEQGMVGTVNSNFLNRVDVRVTRPPLGWTWEAPIWSPHLTPGESAHLSHPEVMQHVRMMLHATDLPGEVDNVGEFEKHTARAAGRVDLLKPQWTCILMDRRLVVGPADVKACKALAVEFDCAVLVPRGTTGPLRTSPYRTTEPAEVTA